MVTLGKEVTTEWRKVCGDVSREGSGHSHSVGDSEARIPLDISMVLWGEDPILLLGSEGTT